ncbi:hypothetical protein ACFLZA_02125 [Candidatus Neomarinimicrobiota bacterium]
MRMKQQITSLLKINKRHNSKICCEKKNSLDKQHDSIASKHVSGLYPGSSFEYNLFYNWSSQGALDEYGNIALCC